MATASACLTRLAVCFTHSSAESVEISRSSTPTFSASKRSDGPSSARPAMALTRFRSTVLSRVLSGVAIADCASVPAPAEMSGWVAAAACSAGRPRRSCGADAASCAASPKAASRVPPLALRQRSDTDVLPRRSAIRQPNVPANRALSL
eukprot:scaffold99292_cov72-Phaeocystis_antarctica.AAC.1